MAIKVWSVKMVVVWYYYTSCKNNPNGHSFIYMLGFGIIEEKPSACIETYTINFFYRNMSQIPDTNLRCYLDLWMKKIWLLFSDHIVTWIINWKKKKNRKINLFNINTKKKEQIYRCLYELVWCAKRNLLLYTELYYFQICQL